MINERRQSRLEEEIKRKLSSIIFMLENPKLGFVTITRVKLSSDLKYAKIHLSFMGDDEKRKVAFEALCGAGKFIRKELSGALKLKTIPELKFIRDDSLDYVFKIETILEKISKNNSD